MTFEELIHRVEAENPSINVRKLIQVAIMQQEFINMIGSAQVERTEIEVNLE